MIEIPDTASAATCAAFAQVLPVFIVALVAERIARFKDPEALRARAMLRFAMLMRILIDLGLAIALLCLSALALTGIESDGISGETARTLWSGTLVVAVAILYRWLLLSTPLLSLINGISSAWGALVTNSLVRLGAALPSDMSVLVTAIGRVVQIASEVVFGVISVGLYKGMSAFSEVLSTGISATIELVRLPLKPK